MVSPSRRCSIPSLTHPFFLYLVRDVFLYLGPLSLCSHSYSTHASFALGPGSLHAPTCYCSGERPPTPGDADAVFCVVALVQVSNYQQAVPRGTGFALSNKHLFTARHNCVDDNGNMYPTVGLVKEIITGDSIRRSDIIMLRQVESNAADDWAVFERVEEEFASSVKICPDGRLPSVSPRALISIKDYPVGLIDTDSTAKLTVASVQVKVYQYEKRLPEANTKSSRKRSAQFAMRIVDDSEIAAQSSSTVEDVIMVAGGRVSGSCGAPYFNAEGEVVAFHVESVDDSDAKSSSHSSHVSYSHGYVLCRLPSFVEWYEKSIDKIV